MKWKILMGVLIVLAVAGGLAAVKTLQIRKLMAAGGAYTAPPESVASAEVREEKWQFSLSAIGSVTAVQGVTVTPEIAGTISEIAFESGALVNRGDLLVRLDTATEEAQLRAVEAQVALARINAERARDLHKTSTLSQSELDTAEATLLQQEANADAIRAAIAKKTLRAPFAGRLGIRQVNLGEYLEAGRPVVSLQALNPVYVDFSLPQQEFARLETGLPVRVTADTYLGRTFNGTLSALNPALDADTRSVRLQATLDNADFALRPGMFARIEVMLAEEAAVLAIPATAILSAPFGDSVYVIEPPEAASQGTNLVVRQQFVRTGRARGDFVSVTAGLQAGQKIVTAGMFKLRNGMAVVEHNELAPQPVKSPRPADS